MDGLAVNSIWLGLVGLGQNVGGIKLGDFMLIGGILIGVMILGGVILLLLRRKLLGGPHTAPEADAMEQLQSVYERGLMTDQEFRRARRASLGLPAEEPPPPEPAEPDHPDETDQGGDEDQ